MAEDAKLSQLLTDYIGYGRYAVPRCTWDRVDLSEPALDALAWLFSYGWK
ncbi:hypothetical protein SAMN06295943_3485 [Agreia sp. VKM Ac-1783]|nr:hypothetical protein SAMN06295943_3485 [Agreia sp. VKM Ac-1783]